MVLYDIFHISPRKSLTSTIKQLCIENLSILTLTGWVRIKFVTVWPACLKIMKLMNNFMVQIKQKRANSLRPIFCILHYAPTCSNNVNAFRCCAVSACVGSLIAGGFRWGSVDLWCLLVGLSGTTAVPSFRFNWDRWRKKIIMKLLKNQVTDS